MITQQLDSRFSNVRSDGVVRRKMTICFTVRALDRKTQLAFARVEIGADRSCIDAIKGGSQLAHRKCLPEAGSRYLGISCRPCSTLPEESGAARTEVEALTVAMILRSIEAFHVSRRKPLHSLHQLLMRWHHHQIEWSGDYWRQFSKDPVHPLYICNKMVLHDGRSPVRCMFVVLDVWRFVKYHVIVLVIAAEQVNPRHFNSHIGTRKRCSSSCCLVTLNL